MRWNARNVRSISLPLGAVGMVIESTGHAMQKWTGLNMPERFLS